MLRRELESEEQGKEFLCNKCFARIDNANKICKKISESVKDFMAARTPQKSAIKSEAAGTTPSLKLEEFIDNDLPTTSTTPKTSKPKNDTNVSVVNISSPNEAISSEEMEVIVKVNKMHIKK